MRNYSVPSSNSTLMLVRDAELPVCQSCELGWLSVCESCSGLDFALASQKGEMVPVSVQAPRRNHSLSVCPFEEQDQLFAGKLLSFQTWQLSAHTPCGMVCVELRRERRVCAGAVANPLVT